MRDFPEDGGAIVTGGSGGIGAAIARRLAVDGVPSALTYNSNEAAAQQAVDTVTAAGATATAHQVDLRDEQAVLAFADAANTALGCIHTVISAHGPFIHMQHISRMAPSLFRETMEADTFAVFNLVHATLPFLRETRGSLVAIATPAIQRYANKDLLSVAPKAAIEAIVRGVASEEGRFGVRANAVGVGVIEDGMFDALVKDGAFDEGFLEASRRNIALKRLGTADEVAELVVFLASNRARWITGQQVNADGGYAI